MDFQNSLQLPWTWIYISIEVGPITLTNIEIHQITFSMIFRKKLRTTPINHRVRSFIPLIIQKLRRTYNKNECSF